MKQILLIIVLVFLSSACQQSEATANQFINKSEGVAAVQANNKPENKKLVSKATDQKKLEVSKSNVNQAVYKNSTDAKDLQEMLTNNVGDLVLITDYKPYYLKGDFNGDSFEDIALVVGAQDRQGETGAVGDLFEGLPFTSGLNFQNIETGFLLKAKPQRSGSEIQNKKSQLKPKDSNLGLLIIFGSAKGWKTTTESTDYNSKFLLLDAVWTFNYEDKQNAPDNLILARKKDKRFQDLSVKARGDCIFSGEEESAGKMLCFDGQKFVAEQWGD